MDTRGGKRGNAHHCHRALRVHVERHRTGVTLGRSHTDCLDGLCRSHIGADRMDWRHHTVRKGLLLIGVPTGNAAGLLRTPAPPLTPAPRRKALPLCQGGQPFPLHLAHTHCRLLHCRCAGNHHLDRPLHHIRPYGYSAAASRGRMDGRNACDCHLLDRCGNGSNPSCRDRIHIGPPRTHNLQYGVSRRQFAEPAQLCPAFPFRHRHRPMHQLPGMRTRLQVAMHQPHRPRGGFIALRGVLQLRGRVSRRRHPLHLAPHETFNPAHAAGEAPPLHHTLM